MQKLLIAAVLATLASAYEIVQAYTNEAAPRTVISESGLLEVSYDYKFDVGYKAYYKNKFDPASDGVEKDSIGFSVNSIIKTQFYFTILGYYQYQVKLEIVPFSFTPLEMALKSSRAVGLIRGDAFKLIFEATHDAKIMQITTSYRKDLKLPSVSVLDAVLDDTKKVYPTTKSFKIAQNEEYNDPVLSIDLFKTLIVKNLPTEYTQWYGPGKYCDFDFVNDL